MTRGWVHDDRTFMNFYILIFEIHSYHQKKLNIIAGMLFVELLSNMGVECVFLGVWFRDPWNIAGVLHPSVYHLHLYLSICLQSHLQHRLYSGQCSTKPGKWFSGDDAIAIYRVPVSFNPTPKRYIILNITSTGIYSCMWISFVSCTLTYFVRYFPGILSHSKEIPSKGCKEFMFVVLLLTQILFFF